MAAADTSPRAARPELPSVGHSDAVFSPQISLPETWAAWAVSYGQWLLQRGDEPLLLDA